MIANNRPFSQFQLCKVLLFSITISTHVGAQVKEQPTEKSAVKKTPTTKKPVEKNPPTVSKDNSGSPLDSPLLIDLFEGRIGQEVVVPNKRQSQKSSQIDPRTADSEAIHTEAKSPLEDVGHRMIWVNERLRALDTSEATQLTQQLIVDELTALIRQSSPRTSKSRSSQPESKSQRPAEKGSAESAEERTGSSESKAENGLPIDAPSIESLVKEVWGLLPPRIRDQVRSPISEQFLPKYERVIADYYRRLATEPTGR